MSRSFIRLPRKERERLMRLEAILDAARDVFARKGFSKATLDEIAQKAEFGKGTLYNYFAGGKEEMLFAILDKLYDEMEAIGNRVLNPERIPATSFKTLLAEYILALFDHFDANTDLFLILTRERGRLMFSSDVDKVSYFVKQRRRLMTTINNVLKQAIENQEIRQLPVTAVSSMILGNIYGYLESHFVIPQAHRHTTSEQAADLICTLMYDGIINTD